MLDRPGERFDVFLSYTRAESEGWTALIHSELEKQLRPYQWTVFKDNVNTMPGQKNWSKRLQRLVDRSRVFIPIIGDDWQSGRVEHLFDERNWVRREIMQALAASNSKKIIPLILNGKKVPDTDTDDLPEEVKPVFNQWQAEFVSGDSEKLKQEIEVLVGKIMGKSPIAAPVDTRLDRELAPLDRNVEVDRIFSAYRDNTCRVFAVAGDYPDCYESFLHRCQGELSDRCGVGLSKESTEPSFLDWRGYAETGSDSSRREKLVQQICASQGVDKNESDLKKYITENHQPMVFYSVCDELLTAEVCSFWLQFWKNLLEESNQDAAIAVLICNRSRSLKRECRNILSTVTLTDPVSLNEGLGAIELAHVIAYHKGHLDYVPADDFRKLVKKAYPWPAFMRKLKMFRPRCRKIRDVLTPLLLR